MSAITQHVDPLSRKLAPVVRELLLAEVERLAAAQLGRVVKPSKADEDIQDACRLVAIASDKLAQCKYERGEIGARRALEQAAMALGKAMRKHGRMPRGL